MIKGLKFLLTAKAALAGIAFVWRIPFRRYSDWLHFSFYDVGLKALTAFALAISTCLLYISLKYFPFLSACHLSLFATSLQPSRSLIITATTASASFKQDPQRQYIQR